MRKPAPGTADVDALFLPGDGRSPEPTRCAVVREDALTLDVDGVGFYTLMWTPVAVADVAHGFTLEDGVLVFDNPPGSAVEERVAERFDSASAG